MLKKVMAMVCAAAMVVGMAVPAFAAPSPTSTTTIESSTGEAVEIKASGGTVEAATNLTSAQKNNVEVVNNVINSNDAKDAKTIKESLAESGIVVSDTTANVIADGDVTTLEQPVEVIQNGDDPVILTDLGEYDFVLMLVENENNETELISVPVNSDGTATVGSGFIVGFVKNK